MSRRLHGIVATVAWLALVATGCGGGEGDYGNNSAPSAPQTVSVLLSSKQVIASPRSLIAGQNEASVTEKRKSIPVAILVSNQSSNPQVLTLSSRPNASDGGFTATSENISPGETTTLKVSLPPGTYWLSGTDDEITPATINLR